MNRLSKVAKNFLNCHLVLVKEFHRYFVKKCAMPEKRFGVLVIHGITANPATVAPIAGPLSDLGLPLRIPVLRGHGTDSPENLRGVTWHDWMNDAEAALLELLSETDKVIVVGHSMGGLIAVVLAGKYRERIDSVVLVAAAVEAATPFAPGKPLGFIAPLAAKFLKKWKFKPLYSDMKYAAGHPNYLWTPIESVKNLLELTSIANGKLASVTMPVLILQSRKDTRISKKCARIIFDRISTPVTKKEIVWFDKTDHEMFLDCEREQVVSRIEGFIRDRLDQ
jgi:carboxylesterase